MSDNKCQTCIFYESYKDSYFDDLEPDEQGFCNGNPKKDSHTFGESLSCEFYLPNQNSPNTNNS